MSRNELLEKLRSILVVEFELSPASIHEDALLVEDLDLDSIDGVAIIVRLEAMYPVEISDDEIREMKTVGDIVRALAAQLAHPQ